MRRFGWLVVMACALGLAVGCAVDPVQDCLDQCEEARSRMCGAGPDTDCNEECDGVQEIYDENKADFDRAGCGGEFDSLWSCLAGADPCATTSPCTREQSEANACGEAFCARNPSDPLCT